MNKDNFCECKLLVIPETAVPTFSEMQWFFPGQAIKQYIYNFSIEHMATTKNESYKRISTYAQSHLSNQIRIGHGSSKKNRPNVWMFVLHVVIQLLTTLLTLLTKRKNRLNP